MPAVVLAEECYQLAADRKAKGFSVIQIVAGLYPDMPAFDPRGASEAGFPWEQDYVRIRPEHFDRADARILHLVDQGFVPCIVGVWGYHLPWMGTELRIVYVPQARGITARQLAARTDYTVKLFDPVLGEQASAGSATTHEAGSWRSVPPDQLNQTLALAGGHAVRIIANAITLHACATVP